MPNGWRNALPEDDEEIKFTPVPKVRCSYISGGVEWGCGAFVRKDNEYRGTCDRCQKKIDAAIESRTPVSMATIRVDPRSRL